MKNFDQLKIIQSHLFEFVKELNRICEENDIKLFAVGGTLLGATRYNGFIPWDDDLDFAIYRKDIDKLEKIINNSNDYEIHIPSKKNKGNYVRFPKIYKKNTIYKQTNNDVNFDQKLFIDIFIIENIPDNKINNLIHGFQCELLSLIGSYVFYVSDGSYLLNNKSNSAKFFIKIIGNFFKFKDYSFWNALAYNYYGKYHGITSNLISIPGGAKHYFGETLKRSIFEDGVKINFCGINLLGPKESDSYLKNRYGIDYMTPPLVDQQMNHNIKYYEVDGKVIIQ